jgi:EmrB/QacA subfamily drug resistance transporter
VTSGYLAVLASLLILAGALGDRYGRRRVFAIGLVGFGATSVLCGLAPSLEALVLARLAQGAAGALLVPGSLAIITATFDGEARARALGTWAAATSAVTLLGPLVGGLLVQAVSWRAAFLVNVPLIVLGWYALRHVPESRDEQSTGRFDWLGAVVIWLAVGGLAFGLTRGQQRGWDDPLAWAAIAVGVIALLVFPVLMVRRPDALVPPRLFRSRAFTTVNLSTLLVYGALYMSFTFQSLFLQAILGYTPLAAGAAGLPSSVMLVLLSNPAGRLAGSLGARPFLVAGPILMGAGLAWLARIPATSEPWLADPGRPASLAPPLDYLVDVLPGQLVFGFGLALLVAPLTIALMGSVPTRNAGLASAINNAVSRVGAPIAGAILFIAVTATFYPTMASLVPGLDPGDPALRDAVQPLTSPDPGLDPTLAEAAIEASTRGFHLAMLVSAVVLWIGGIVNAIGLPARRPRPTRAGEPR